MTDLEEELKKLPYYSAPSDHKSIKCCNCGLTKQMPKRGLIFPKADGGARVPLMFSWCMFCGLPLSMTDNDRCFGEVYKGKIIEKTDPFMKFMEGDKGKDGNSSGRK